MEIEILTNEEKEAIKGGKWVIFGDELIWIEDLQIPLNNKQI